MIFGANVGTTITGWLVAPLGLRLQIGSLVFAPILIGALLRLDAVGTVDAVGGTRRLESLRWLLRVSHHVWRVSHYSGVLHGMPADDDLAADKTLHDLDIRREMP